MSASLPPFLCLRVCSEELDELWLSESRHTLAVAGTPLHYGAVIVLNRERGEPLLVQSSLANLWQCHDIQWFTDARVKLGRSSGYRWHFEGSGSEGGLCSLRCAFPWPLAAGPLQSPMRQLLRSRLLCILTLCEQVPNGHYTKTAASL